jgi:hypothetical protein
MANEDTPRVFYDGAMGVPTSEQEFIAGWQALSVSF